MQIDISHLLLVAIAGFLILNRKKSPVKEDAEVKQKIKELETSSNQIQLQIKEEQKGRETIEAEMRQKTNEILDEKSIVEFFNTRK